MRPVQKLFFLGLLFSLLSFLPISISESETEFDLENKANPRLNSITSPMVDDFLVNDDTGSVDQYQPDIAADSAGNFRIAWLDYRDFHTNIYSQRYNSSGVPVGANVRLTDDSSAGWRYDPAFSMNSSGDFVIAWACDCADGATLNVDIYAQKYDALGTASGSLIKANDDAGDAYQDFPAAAIDDRGSFVITWHDSRDGNFDIYAQRYNSTGIPLGTNFKVNDDTGTTMQELPGIAVDGFGNYVIAWSDERNGKWDIYAQRFNA